MSDQMNRSREDLAIIATRQKGVIYCLLFYIIALVIQFVLPTDLRIIAGLVGLAATIAAVVFVFMLATKVYGAAGGIILGILTLIPLIGLIILLVVNGKATSPSSSTASSPSACSNT